MIVNYRAWLKDREDPKSRMQFIVVKFFVHDLMAAALEVMQAVSDSDWQCYRVDFVNIEDFADMKEGADNE